MFDHIDLISRIGRGGMAEVYKAFDPELDRYVAIKRLREELLHDEQIRRRFSREAQTLSRFSHRNIVSIHRHGRRGHEYWIEMEYVDGNDLQSILDRLGRPIPALTSILLLLDVTSGLAAAHESGVIHRDLKPGNVLLTSTGVAKIADLGLAHLQDQTTHLTRTGQAMGTRGYMSPEQEAGEQVTTATDLYSLGVLAHRILTGKLPERPHRGVERHPFSLGSEDETIDLSARALSPLSTLIDQLLQTRPVDRPPHAHFVAERLEACLRELGQGEMPEPRRRDVLQQLLRSASDPARGAEPTPPESPRGEQRRASFTQRSPYTASLPMRWTLALVVLTVAVAVWLVRPRVEPSTTPPEPQVGWIHLRLAPPADVALGDSVIAELVSDDVLAVPAGSITLRGKTDDYGWVEIGNFEVEAGDTTRSGFRTLWSTVEIESTPPGANVSFDTDTAPEEVTPARAELGLGSREIWIDHDGRELERVFCHVGEDQRSISWRQGPEDHGYLLQVPIQSPLATTVLAVFKP